MHIIQFCKMRIGANFTVDNLSKSLGFIVAIVTVLAGITQIAQYFKLETSLRKSEENPVIAQTGTLPTNPTPTRQSFLSETNSEKQEFSSEYKPKHSVSFDCSKARFTIEKIICTEENAAHADLSLDAVYTKIMKKIPPEERKVLRTSQTAWIVRRRTDCAGQYRDFSKVSNEIRHKIANCVVDHNEKRTDQLNEYARTR